MLTELGANTLTFVIPAEIFPTCYRCTCHGISAAAGKVGSIIAVVVVYWINAGYSDPRRQGLVFLLFGSIMIIGAIFSWAYLPNIQRRGPTGHLETKNLEELGEGREKARQEGDIITIKAKWGELRRRGLFRRRRGREVNFVYDRRPDMS
jgi:PHS family inorganic phosphate transporter-like MFS transporter